MEQGISLKKAAVINASAKYMSVIFNLIFNAILARILTPEDYGVVAVVTVFTTFFTLISDMGFAAAVVQNKNLTSEQMEDINSFVFYAALILGVCFAGLSFLIALFYDDDVYIPIGFLLAVSLFFNTASIISNAQLNKHKRFICIGKRTIISVILQGVVTTIMALLGWKYYSIIIAYVVVSIFIYTWNTCAERIRLKLKFSKSSIKIIWEYSIYQFLFNTINYFARNLDNLLTGKVMGNVLLGFYDKAYKLVMYPITNITNVITPVMHPIFSEYQNNKKYIYERYLEVLKILSLSGIFISVYCLFASKEIVLILYGKQWNESVDCFKLLSISIWFQMTASSCGSIYQSIGNTKLMFKSATRFVPIQILAIVFGVYTKRIEVLAGIVAVSFIIKFFVDYYYLICCGFKYKIWDFYSKLLIDVLIGIVLAAILWFASIIKIDNLFISAIYKLFVELIGFMLLLKISRQDKYFLKLLKR